MFLFVFTPGRLVSCLNNGHIGTHSKTSFTRGLNRAVSILCRCLPSISVMAHPSSAKVTRNSKIIKHPSFLFTQAHSQSSACVKRNDGCFIVFEIQVTLVLEGWAIMEIDGERWCIETALFAII